MKAILNIIALLVISGNLFSQTAYPMVKRKPTTTETPKSTQTKAIETTDSVSTPESLELEVEGIYDYGSTQGYLVRLVEKDRDPKDDKWALDMIVGSCEAIALSKTVNEVPFSRPLTYDLFADVLKKSSLALKHILLTKLEDGTYYAELVIDDNGKELRVDARPSDSINLALKASVPIYANLTLWEMAKEKIE